MLALLLLACLPKAPETPQPEARSFTVLAFNDVYRVEGFPESGEGGLARLRALRVALEQRGEVLVTGAGDFLNPSLLSRTFHGEQMIDALNQLDGDPGFDPRLLLTFGNHEFDDDDCEDADLLAARVAGSRFNWLASDLTFGPCVDAEGATRAPPGGDNLLPHALVELGGVTVGVFSVMLPLEGEVPYLAAHAPPEEAAREAIAALREAGAELIFGLTHQSLAQDLALIEALGDDAPHLVLGGHEHVQQLDDSAGPWVVKADADARSAMVVEVVVNAEGVHATPRRVALDATGPAPDPAMQALVDDWLARHEARFCAEVGAPEGCLGEALGRTRTPLIAEELEIRRFETSLGNWVADQALAAFRGQGADLALLNSGSLRLNQDLPADTAVTRRHVETLFAFPAGLVLLELSGAQLQAALDHAITDWTGNGRFLQVAGLRFVHDPVAGTATQPARATEAGWLPIDPEDTVRVVVSGYMAGGGDGYAMLAEARRVAEGFELKELVIEGLRASGEAGIGPVVEGRICNTARDEGCRDTLAPSPAKHP